MRLFITLFVASLLLGCKPKHEDHSMNARGPQSKHHHGLEHRKDTPGKGASLMVATDPTPPLAGVPVKLRLMIHAANGEMVNDFQAVHENKVHLAIISEGLEHFAHIHPAVDHTGILSDVYTFPAGGRYRLFADYAPAGGQPTTAMGSLSVAGRFQPTTAPVPDAPGEIEADGVHATISAGPLKAVSPVRVAFTLRDERGDPITLEPYMGELGHLMFVGVGTWRFVHVHPVGGVANRGSVEFEAHFPEPGMYKGWAQFKQGGVVKVIPLVVKAD